MTDSATKRFIQEVVLGYVIRQGRTLATGHDALFARALRLFALIEGEVAGDRADAKSRIESFLQSPVARGLTSLLPKRTERLIATAVTVQADNRRVMARLEQRVVEEAATAATAIEALYREALVLEVPHQRSLDNLGTVAEACDELHDLLTKSGFFGRTLRTRGWSLIRSTLLKDPAVRAEADSLWQALQDDPSELRELARAMRDRGPEVLRSIYESR